jgi:hypothetical protein
MGNIIIGIHGLSNKPKEAVLKKGWGKAMLEGLAKNAGVRVSSINFISVYWADVMYEKPDPNPDLYRSAKPGAIKRYKDGWLDTVRAKASDITDDAIDTCKNLFGIDTVAEAALKAKLEDLYKYYHDDQKRKELRKRLKEQIVNNRDKIVMLVAHSMGSIIAYDVLRLLGKEDPTISIDHFLTIGSPLGMPHVKYKIAQENSLVRTPSIVKRWSNLADRRDPVSIDTHLSDDYEPNDYGVKVKDDLVLNDWGGIHHKSYGYLRTPEFTDILKKFV